MAKVVKRNIIVEIGYCDFVFEDLIAANAFAAAAKSHQSDGDSDREVKLTIDYERVEEEAKNDQTTD